MTFNKSPAAWLGAGYEVDSVNHCIKLNTSEAATDKLLAELTDDEADPTTGDIRKIVFALMEMLYTVWSEVLPDSRPQMITLYKSSQSSGSTLTHSYSVTSVNDVTEQEVADEPVAE